MLADTMLQAQLHHACYEISHHIGLLEIKEGSGNQGGVEFQDLTNRLVLNRLPEPLNTIVFSDHVECSWDYFFNHLRGHSFWNRLTEVAQH